jgi:formylglycine-generating enzyme required for sulfatase activity
VIALVKFKLAFAAVAAVSLAAPIAGRDVPSLSGLSEADFVTVAGGVLHYRPAGEFVVAGRPADPDVQAVAIRRPITIMRRQVTAGEYQACVDDGACAAVQERGAADPRRPVVKVSWRDASAYAAWASRKSGVSFRLPTDEEWSFAAGGLLRQEARLATSADPSKRWLARYEAEAARDEGADKEVRPVGAFGINEYGLADMAGNVWEWTESCYRRVRLDELGREIAPASVNCGVRVVAGRHRTYMTDFVRDPRSGGCAFGVPPSNLGFRLVRDDGVFAKAWNPLSAAARALHIARS